jgi:hypothetical protein
MLVFLGPAAYSFFARMQVHHQNSEAGEEKEDPSRDQNSAESVR